MNAVEKDGPPGKAKRRLWSAVVALAVLASGCGGGGEDRGPSPTGVGVPSAEPSPTGVGVPSAEPSPTGEPTEVPVWIPGLGRLDAPGGVFVDIGVGALSSCGVREGGELVCWGDERAEDWWGAVLDHAPVQWGFSRVEVWDSVVRFTGADIDGEHACGLRSDGAVVCWGHEFGWLGEAEALEAPEWWGGVWLLGSGAPAGEGASGEGGFVDIVAGMGGVCGLRADGSAACWDGRRFSDAGVPDGGFSRVVAGWPLCGLRFGGEFVCWGPVRVGGEFGLPGGEFVDVSAVGTVRGGVGCGLRFGGELACWGIRWDYQDRGRLPEGRVFSQVAVSARQYGVYGCGVSPQFPTASTSHGRVLCWGDHRSVQSDPPYGAFTQVAVGPRNSCGLHHWEGKLECWGEIGWLPQRSEVSLVQVSMVDRVLCGLRADGTAVCLEDVSKSVWDLHPDPESGGDWNPWHLAPVDGLIQVAAGPDISGAGLACGLRADGTAACWELGSDEAPVEVPEGRLIQISADEFYGLVVCGLRADGTVSCWRFDEELSRWLQLTTPAGAFEKIDARGPCGVLAGNGRLLCWEYSNSGDYPPSALPLSAVSAGGGRYCGVRATDRALVCWLAASRETIDLGGGFGGEFADVSVGPTGALCAIRADRTLACDGAFLVPLPPHRQTPAALPKAMVSPDGEFSQVAVGFHHACAIRADGTAVCWGYEHDGAGGRSRYFEADGDADFGDE